MRYTYDVYKSGGDGRSAAVKMVDCTTRFEEVEHLKENDKLFSYAVVTDNIINRSWSLITDEDFAGHRDRMERVAAWKPDKKTPTILGCNPLPVGKTAHSVIDDDGFHQTTFSDPKDSPTTRSMMHKKSDSYQERLIEALDALEKGTTKDHINPSHYQNFIDEYQWLEAQCRIPEHRNHPDRFLAAVKLQVRKYMDRDGRKDESLQELEKGLWYYKFMVAYMKNDCEPILVKDIDTLLRR